MSSFTHNSKLHHSKSLAESLLGTKGSKTISTTRTSITFSNFIKMVRSMIIWIELIGYIIIWCLYIFKSKDDVVNKYIFNKGPFHMTYLQAYYGTQIIVQATMIILCMVFFIEFILYTDRDWISEVKKEKDKVKLNSAFGQIKQPSDSTDGFPIKKYKYKKSKVQKNALSIIDDCNICARLCSFTFCFRRIGACIFNIFTLTWSELHILCMLSCIYYLLSAMLRLYHFNPSKEQSQVLFTISDILTGFGIILPPFAYNLCLKLKMIYDRRGSISDATVAGSLWEKSKANYKNKNWYQSSSQMSIVQASKSILNDKVIKFWMFIMFSLQFFIFVVEPVFAPNKFRYYLQSMYDCWDSTDDYNDYNHDYICNSTTSQVVFVVHILIMRIAIPLLLLNTVFCFTPKSSHTAQIMHYYYFYNIITPSSIILITIIAFATNYFLSGHYIIVTWSGVACILFISLWQIFIFVRLLTLAEDAENDQEQFYGFAQRLNASLFNYFSKGILLIILWSVSFGALLLTNVTPKGQIDKVYRQIPSVIFAATSMFLLVPLQKIAISPTYRNYFKRKNRTKYLVTFHIICLISAVFIVAKFIFVATFYYDILTNEPQMKDVSFALSFSLSFASIGFFIWLFGKYSGVLYPIEPKPFSKSRSRNVSVTELSEINNVKSRNSKKRKDSNLSLTALYHNRTPSLPQAYDVDEEDSQNEFKNNSNSHDMNKIGSAKSITPQRTKSLSVQHQKSNSKKIDMGRNKSTDVQKATSMSQRKLHQMVRSKYNDNESVFDPVIDTYDDAAKIYGLKNDNVHDEVKYSES